MVFFVPLHKISNTIKLFLIMMKILGSQFGLILFLVIGCLVVVAINKARGEKMDNESSDNIVGCFVVAGFIFVTICVVLSECSNN